MLRMEVEIRLGNVQLGDEGRRRPPPEHICRFRIRIGILKL